ncbi:MAG TPA: class I SAM-dependent methyltransferase [Phycisphaerae bacterium]|nr:class I SAM-dependent methyltransferase [Phycisphaerae bacterium]HRW52034.1 class I SAM-dependent methyltransferase [Phycisphaerae bacterium]
MIQFPARVLDRLRWEWREWHTPSRPSFQHEELDHTLLKLIPWSADERVLDVGCAHGVYLRELADRGVAVTGLDVSRDALRRARLAKRPVIAASGDRLPFRDASYDTILCHKTMYLFRSPETALREFARVLQPGGRLVFSTSATRTPYALAQRLAVGLLDRKDWAAGNRLDAWDWVRRAEAIGFGDARFYSCNLVAPIVFRVCDRWIIPNEWMRRYARTIRQIVGTNVDSNRPSRMAQDVFVVLRKLKTRNDNALATPVVSDLSCSPANPKSQATCLCGTCCK